MALALEVAGITREDMATELDVHRNTISNYLSGRTTPTRSVLIAWRDITGAPLAWLESGAPDLAATSILGAPTDRYRHSNDGWYVDGKRASYIHLAMAA